MICVEEDSDADKLLGDAKLVVLFAVEELADIVTKSCDIFQICPIRREVMNLQSKGSTGEANFI